MSPMQVPAHQPLFEVATAYQKLPPLLASELQACFDGDRNLAQTHDIARRLVNTLAPDALALVVTRLICVADERPAHGGDVDIDLGAPA